MNVEYLSKSADVSTVFVKYRHMGRQEALLIQFGAAEEAETVIEGR